ncbi:MAG: hypothetical protein II411_03600, partial [Lachnospiraceae bacterium]|nr:hypothetical protein [Lachnospiraceae bacterium]
KNIVIKGTRFIDYRINSAREMIVYNAQFEKAEYMTSNDDSAISIADNNKKKLILERVEFKGLSDNRYTNTDLISLEGGNANSEIEFIGVNIRDYKSYSNNLIYANNGIITFNEYNEISNCSNIEEKNITALININSGEFTVVDSLVIENNRVHGKNILRVGENATFVAREDSIISITKNISMKYEENHGVVEFKNSPNILGNFSLTENKILSSVENSNYIVSGMYVAVNKKITLGNGIMTIKENDIYVAEAENDLNENLHAYQLYSETSDNKTELFTQNSTAKFNKQNFIAGIAFANELGHGIVLKDWENNAEEKETFEKQVVADNHYRKSIKTIVIDEDLAIHNVFTVEFFVGEGVYAPDISTQSVLINKNIKSVATPSDPEHREREFIGWATKSDATINEVVDVDEYEIVEDTAFYAVFEYFEEHIHKICGYASGDFCFHEGLATHSGDIEYMPLTLRYVQKNGMPTSGNYYLHENIIYNKVATVSNTLNICLNGKSLKVDKFISLDRQKVTISNCRDTNVEINVKAGEMMFDNVVPSILSAKGTINVKTDCVVSYENATTTDRMEIYNVIFNPVSDEVSSLALFKTSYSAENGSRLFIASTSISNYNLTAGSLIVNRNNTWFTKKLFISENNISSYLLNNEGAFTIDTVIASANTVKLNAVQNTVNGANITYRGNSIFANNKFYRQYMLSHAQITYNGNTSFVNNEFNIENGRYPFMQSNYTATNTYVGGETIFDGNKDVTPNNNAAAAFLYYEGNVDIFNSAKLIIRNNKLEKNTVMQSIFLISNNNYLRLT